MTQSFSKTQIDRLGERLKQNVVEDTDLRMLAEYRNIFAEAFEQVVSTIRKELTLEPTGRAAKSNASIIAKLRRESIRLSQMQDIAGCRLIVPDVITQDQLTQSLASVFENTTMVDRRKHPSYGYRAIHIIVHIQERLIEVQIRTSLQQIWAEISERAFDLDPAIKYGGGDEIRRGLLLVLSQLIEAAEYLEVTISTIEDLAEREDAVWSLTTLKQMLDRVFQEFISKLNERKENAVSN